MLIESPRLGRCPLPPARLRIPPRCDPAFVGTQPLVVALCGVCDVSEQASHNGELAHACEAGALGRDNVTELGAVLTGQTEGRRSADEITAFDSTGLAIQDLAIAIAAFEYAGELELPTLEL